MTEKQEPKRGSFGSIAEDTWWRDYTVFREALRTGTDLIDHEVVERGVNAITHLRELDVHGDLPGVDDDTVMQAAREEAEDRREHIEELDEKIYELNHLLEAAREIAEALSGGMSKEEALELFLDIANAYALMADPRLSQGAEALMRVRERIEKCTPSIPSELVKAALGEVACRTAAAVTAAMAEVAPKAVEDSVATVIADLENKTD